MAVEELPPARADGEPKKTLPRGLVFIVGGILLVGISGVLVAAAGQAVVARVSLDSLASVPAGSYVEVAESRLEMKAAFPATEARNAFLVPVLAPGDSLAMFDSTAFAAVRERDLKTFEPGPLRGAVLDKRPDSVPARAVLVDVSQTPDNLSRGGLSLSALGFFLLIIGILRRILTSPPKPAPAGQEGPSGSNEA